VPDRVALRVPGRCTATSNVLAGPPVRHPVRWQPCALLGPVVHRGAEAFDANASVLPGNAVMLVDTYDTLEGVARAIETGRAMRARGQRLAGIRLDSGDLAYLSIRAREMLDAAGFEDARIVASNDLDPETIESLNGQGARIDVWGVGTKSSLLRPAGPRVCTSGRHAGARWDLADPDQDQQRFGEDRPSRACPAFAASKTPTGPRAPT